MPREECARCLRHGKRVVATTWYGGPMCRACADWLMEFKELLRWHITR